MKKVLLSIALAAGFANAAVAADLPMKARAMAPAPAVATNWTGCYVGAGGGYGMFDQRHRSIDPFGVPFTATDSDAGGKGWFGTVQVGCDIQFAQRWVVGAFGDFDFSGIKGNLQPQVPMGGINGVGEEKLRNSWAAGARVGYLIFPGLLGYVSGGYTQARFDGVTFVNVFTGVPNGFTMDAQTYKGWFLGTGYEYALDFLPGLFWKTEYRYASYREESPAVRFAGAVGAAGPILAGFERGSKDVQTIRSELVWRFNFGGPVVAKY